MRGLLTAGMEVIDMGLVTTPMLYFAANTLCTSGIQVTGSHNPKDYNGFKMVMGGRAIYGDEIQALRRTSWSRKLGAAARWPGAQVDVLPAYRERVLWAISAGAPDENCGGFGQRHCRRLGAGILRAIGCEVTELFSEVDGNFPNHHPDPSKPENLRDLIAALKSGRRRTGPGL
jgi:phosphomannomutase